MSTPELHSLIILWLATPLILTQALKHLDTRKPTGPDNLEISFLKLAADFIAHQLLIFLIFLWIQIKFQPYGSLLFCEDL